MVGTSQTADAQANAATPNPHSLYGNRDYIQNPKSNIVSFSPPRHVDDDALGIDGKDLADAGKIWGRTLRDRAGAVVGYAVATDRAHYDVTGLKKVPELPIGQYEVERADGAVDESFENTYTQDTKLNRLARAFSGAHKAVLGKALDAAKALPIVQDIALPVPERIRFVEQEAGNYEADFGVSQKVRIGDMTPTQVDTWLRGIHFNQSEGMIRDYGEQSVLISMPFAMLGTGDRISRGVFDQTGRFVSAIARVLNPETRQDQLEKWHEEGGVTGTLKRNSKSAMRHVLRDHLSDWNVGLFYVYAKEWYMRNVGAIDTPEKEEYVMRRAFTWYNLYVELVHNTTYDFIEDLFTGNNNGGFNKYRERHAPQEDKKLNILARGWNFTLDIAGYWAERGTQVFAAMMGAVYNFGNVRFRGKRNAAEMKQKYRLDAWSDENHQQFADYTAKMNMALEYALHDHENAVDNQKIAKWSEFLPGKAPTMEHMLKAGFTADQFGENGEFKDPKLREMGYKVGFPSDSATYKNYHKDFEAFAKRVSESTRGLSDGKGSVAALLDKLQSSSDGRGRDEFAFDIMMDAMSAYGIPEGYGLLNRGITGGDGSENYKEDDSRNLVGGSYATYIGKKRAFLHLAEESKVIRAFTDAATDVTDFFKFGTENNVFYYAKRTITAPIRAVKWAFGFGGKDASEPDMPEADKPSTVSHHGQSTMPLELQQVSRLLQQDGQPLNIKSVQERKHVLQSQLENNMAISGKDRQQIVEEMQLVDQAISQMQQAHNVADGQRV